MSDENEEKKPTLVEKLRSKVDSASDFLANGTMEDVAEAYCTKVAPIRGHVEKLTDYVPISINDAMLAVNIATQFLPYDSPARDYIGLALDVPIKTMQLDMHLALKRKHLAEKLQVDMTMERHLRREEMDDYAKKLAIRCSENYIQSLDEELSWEELENEVDKRVGQVTLNFDKVHFPTSKKIKTSLVAKFLGQTGVKRIFTPLSGEVQVPKKTEPNFDLAFIACHEHAHRKRHPKEYEAQVIADLACSLSDYKTFHTGRDFWRLGMTLRVLFDKDYYGGGWTGTKKGLEAQHKYVNELPMGDFLKYYLHDQTKYIPEEERKEMPLKLRGMLEAGFLLGYGARAYSDQMLKKRGQPAGNKSYSETYLKVIRAFEKGTEKEL